MRQLNYIGARQLEWHDVPAPTLDADHAALVRPTVVATCDADGFLIAGGFLKGPYPVGHEGLGVVEEIGDAVTSIRPGDQCVIPWKISCGFCVNCSRGLTAQCLSVPHEDMYGWGPRAPKWGGFLSDRILVPWADHMLCPLPEGTDPLAAAGCADNITDGWRAVGPALKERPGGRVLVLGGAGPGSIGVYAAGWACAMGAGETVYLDLSAERRAVAAGYGASVRDIGAGLPEDLASDFDITVDAGGAGPKGLTWLLQRTGRGGLCTSVAAMIYVRGPVPLPMHHMYRNSVRLDTGWAHTRALMEEPLSHVASGKFDPVPVVTKVHPFSSADEALREDYVKLLFTREPAPAGAESP
jgi:alcohol dehydrogenase